MHKITLLTMILIGSAYGMDRPPTPQDPKQNQQEPDLEALRQDPGSLLSKMPSELFPIVEKYNPRKLNRELQELHLQGLTQLQRVFLSPAMRETAGKENLEKALPNLYIIYHEW